MRSGSRLGLGLALLPLAALWEGAAMAASVTELKPSQVVDFVAKHHEAVIQVTSPDRGCGYCVGADKAFDKAAAASKRPVAYARVQHKPWRAIPDFGDTMKIYGVPTVVAFLDGKRVNDVMVRPAEKDRFLAEVDRLMTGVGEAPPAVTFTKTTPQPPSETETAALRTMVRRDLLKGAMEACGKRFPAGAATYRDAVTKWEAPRKEALNRGAMAMLTANADMRKLANEEQQALAAWQSNELGIPMTKKVEAADCDKLAGAIPQMQ